MKRIAKISAFATWIALIVVLAAATIVEKCAGSESAHTHIYSAWWFVALWGVMAVCSLCHIISTFRSFAFHPVTFCLHLSFLLILCGAFLTYLLGDKGYLHLRQNEQVNFYISVENAERCFLPFSIRLILFDIRYHDGTEQAADYISYVEIDHEVRQISMNNILKQNGYRFYQMDYDADEMGSLLMVSYDPYGIAVTYVGYALLGLSMLLLLIRKIRWKGLLWLFVPTAGLWFYISQLNPMTPVLRSPMLAIHVSVILIAYLLLFAMMVVGIIALTSPRRLARLAQLNRQLLYPAVFMLAAGIFLGAVWANISWGRYWGWDAKETWALITLMIYSLAFHRRSLLLFSRPRAFQWFCVLAFSAILMTFFGVSYLLGGIHSYV
ncbi:MAG: cytochrome c biogenesis protein CcsA [Candidatus Symbiothrix sp.]|jgi:ABC-type transport system involved in cytochrome c biogenesis permease subunit|nr:cytochrome c biogenesis protein CcsA [Candidatus Symbiothrix sp.]